MISDNAAYNKPVSVELLMDYVEGLLDKETSDLLSVKIAENEELASVVEGIRFFYKKKGTDRTALEQYLYALSKNLPDWLETTYKVPVRKKIPQRYLLYRIAAAIAVFVTVGMLLYITVSRSTPGDELVAEELSIPYSAPLMVRGDHLDMDKHWMNAVDAYKKSDFMVAATFLADILKKEPDNYYASFYMGLCYLYEADAARAIPYFKAAVDPESRIQEQAQWYLALALYANGEREECRKILRGIVQESEYRHQRANELLNYLE